MVVVKKSANVKEMECAFCHSILEYEDADIVPLYCGKGIVCPNCGNENYTVEFEEFTFPDGFFHTYSKKDGVKPLTDEEVQELIDAVTKHLDESEVGEYYMTQTGDTVVFGFHLEDSIEVYVSKDFYEMEKFR